MSQQNVETVRRLNEAFNRGDLDTAIGVFDNRAEWQMAREDPDCTTQRVWVRITGRSAASGVDIEMQEAYVYTLREGKILCVEEYFDRLEALEAVGLAEQTPRARSVLRSVE